MAFFEELKQRKVIRVAAAYLVVAWLSVQVASIALPAFEAPGWVLRVLILLLALGFPMALVLAWAVDLTPEGARFSPGGTGWKRLLAICGVLAAVAVGWYWFGQPAWRKADFANPAAATIAAAPKPSPAAARANPRSIAVLPFVNMSGDPANEYFSDGLAETTLDMLAQVHDLKVIARTSSFAFKGKNDDVRTIGRKLDAAHLLEGSVQQAGKTVRVTAQLVRTSDGIHLWSKRFDRQMTDVFAIQDEIAGEVVKALQVALPAGDAARLTGGRTKDVEAYRSYLRGLALLPKRRVSEMREAVGHFERAIALDPHYAEAHAAASMALGLVGNYSGHLSPEAKARRKRYFETALELDPKLGEAWAARGAWFNERGENVEARRNYQRAVELAPNYATGFQWYAELLMREFGDPAAALPLYEKALALDPLSPIVRSEHANAMVSIGRSEEGERLMLALVRDHPDFVGGHYALARLHEARGDLVGALRASVRAEQVDPEAVNSQRDCWLLLRFGALDRVRRCVARTTRGAGDSNDLVSIRAQLLWMDGKPAQALALIDAMDRKAPWERATYLLESGRGAEALALLQTLDPGMFVQPEPRLTSAYPADAVLAGHALLASGATAQGRDLLQRALRHNADRPVDQLQFGKRWLDAITWSLLGDMPRACVALRQVAASGFHMDIAQLDVMSATRELRKQPCYAPALSPARARAAAHVAAAERAGLLKD
jgi:adenylate cyclase